MTNRERFARVMAFEPVDRIPMLEWAHWWNQTIDAWKSQGLAIAGQPGLNAGESLQKQMGLDLQMQLSHGMCTAQTPRPSHHGAPIVTSEAEYEAILPTLYPRNAVNQERLREMARRQQTGEAITWITVEGFFWGPRVLLGIEPHLFAFYDAPDLMHRINQDLVAYNLHIFEQVYEVLQPDFMTFLEDMSYNNGPMLSEAMFDAFLLPYYQQIVPVLKAHGTRVIIDSDGDITRAVPWFLRAGIEGVLPLEKQAGVDLAALREDYPEFLCIGHYDKMVMPHGEAAMRAEFERLLPLMKKGGFIPSVDHQTPPGVTLEQYHIYVRLLAEYTRKAGQPAG